MSVEDDIKNVDKYSLLTEQKIKSIIEDVMYHGHKLTDDELDLMYPIQEFVDAPEGWEDNRREELKKTILPGAYYFENLGVGLWTGQGGAIDIQIALEKSLLGYK